MKFGKTNKWFTVRRLRAIRRVIREIDRYDGVPIVAGKHPLHKAVVALEGMLDDGIERGRRQNTMIAPAHGQWLFGLWASRDGSPNHKYEFDPLLGCGRRWSRDRKNGPSGIALARLWFSDLKRTLESWLVSEPEQWEYRCRSRRERAAT